MQWQWQRGRVLVYKDAVHVRMWRILRKRTPSSWRCPDRKSLFSLFLYPSQQTESKSLLQLHFLLACFIVIRLNSIFSYLQLVFFFFNFSNRFAMSNKTKPQRICKVCSLLTVTQWLDCFLWYRPATCKNCRIASATIQ